MLEDLKQTFNDIRDAIIEMGGDVDYCDSPTTYAQRIMSLQGGRSLLFTPIYKASATKPARPTEPLSMDDPTHYPEGWSTPDGLEGKLWMSYSLVGQSHIYIPWTDPIPVQNEYSGVSRTFMIYAKVPSITINPNTPTGGYWDTTLNKLVGNVTSTSSTGTTIQWSTDNETSPSGVYTWLSIGTFSSSGSQIGSWSDPFCINTDGKDGRDGADGKNIEFIFKLVADEAAWHSEPTPYSKPHENDYIPETWNDHPTGISPTMQIELVCTRKLNAAAKEWGSFSAPTPWAMWAEDGTDGDGVEYIFRIATLAEVDRVNTGAGYTYKLNNSLGILPPMSENHLVAVAESWGCTQEQIEALKVAYQQDDWVPGDMASDWGWNKNWTDNPLDVSSTQPFEFVSIRKWDHQAETWGYFCEPLLWTKFPNADVSVFTAFAFTRTSVNFGSYTPTGGTSANPVPDDYVISVDPPITIHWTDTVPTGTAPVWMTTRLFSTDMSEDQGWDSPRLLADNPNFQIEYSHDYDGTSWYDPDPQHPNQLPDLNDFVDSSVEGINEDLWRQACLDNNLGHWADDDRIVDPIYMATCRRSKGTWGAWKVNKIKGEKGASVTSEIRYYKGDTRGPGDTPPVEAPDVADPTQEPYNWRIRPGEIVLSDELQYLWCFVRTIYSDNTWSNSNPYVVSTFIDDVEDILERVGPAVEQQVTEQLGELDDRLDTVQGITTRITDDGGLYSIMNNYTDVGKKQFADLIINAEEATIKQWAGAEVAGYKTSAGTTINGLESKVNTYATKTDTTSNRVDVAEQTIGQLNTDLIGIRNDVSQGIKVWKLSQPDQHPNEPTVVIWSTYKSESEARAHGYEPAFNGEVLSTIQQTADSIGMAVGSKDSSGVWHSAAGIDVIRNAETNQGKIVLKAENTVINGNAVVNGTLSGNAIAANTITGDKINTDTLTAKTVNSINDNNGLQVTIENGLLVVKDTTASEDQQMRIALGISDGDTVLTFYNSNGQAMYDLGPGGFFDMARLTNPSWEKVGGSLALLFNSPNALISAWGYDGPGWTEVGNVYLPKNGQPITYYCFHDGYKELLPTGQQVIWSKYINPQDPHGAMLDNNSSYNNHVYSQPNGYSREFPWNMNISPFPAYGGAEESAARKSSLYDHIFIDDSSWNLHTPLTSGNLYIGKLYWLKPHTNNNIWSDGDIIVKSSQTPTYNNYNSIEVVRYDITDFDEL